MKKYFIIAFIGLFGLLKAYSQNQQYNKNRIPIPEFKKSNFNIDGDTIWQYHKYEIFKWEDNQYQNWDYYSLLDYYSDTKNIKTIKFVDYNNDSLFKTDYYYDSLDREISEITKNYDSISQEWINSTRADFYYSFSGKDSLRIVYTWDMTDSVWNNNSMHILLWNDFGYISYEADSVWINQKWTIIGGRKFEYVYNEYNQVLEQAWYEYEKNLNNWIYHFKNVFTLINEQTGEYNGAFVYLWNKQNNEWTNFQRFSEMQLHNWEGFPYYAPKVEHDIMEAWIDENWVFVKKDSMIYDTLGGKIWYYFVYNYNINQWQPYFKLLDVYNDEGYQISYYRQFWQDDQWVNHDGYIISYEFDGPRLIEVKKDEWDTITGQWTPFRKYVYSDYSYILNTENIGSTIKRTQFKIIPNPSNRTVLIKLNDETDRIKKVKIYNLTGHKVLNKNFSSENRQEEIDISGLKKSVYILNVITKQGKIMKGKMIKD